MIMPHPSTRTKSRILKGSEIITGGSIIMPMDMSAAETTRSMMRKGMKMTKPMMNAARSSESMKDGMSVSMGTDAVLDIGVQGLLVAAKLCAPILVTALVVGFTVSLLQSITQIQEVTLSFVPKAIAVSLALLICGHWMISEMISFTHELFARIPGLLGS